MSDSPSAYNDAESGTSNRTTAPGDDAGVYRTLLDAVIKIERRLDQIEARLPPGQPHYDAQAEAAAGIASLEAARKRRAE